jgi:cellulose synthase/poly-beta-1,6-N-acetylglucosamine synthase-like glycosyltransferase
VLLVSQAVALAVVASVSLLVPATAAVFLMRTSRTSRRPGGVAMAASLVALTTVGGAGLAGAPPAPAALVGALLGASVLAWAPLARHWAVRGVVAWALTLDAGLSYLLYVAHWTLTSGLSLGAVMASTVLWLLEAFIFLLAVGYVWEFVDVVTRRQWPRRVRLPSPTGGPRPFVSVHVPTHNEPPDMVIATVRALLAQAYDHFEVLVVDNNTVDPALWRPVEEFCRTDDRVTFLHLEDWPGYKSGALNYALTVTDPRAEVIGIVDADYLVRPDFLARCAPLFGDESVGFVQTPQDYRGWEQSPYFRRLYHSYDYFFEVSQRSRNERNGAIFGGTMGLIRRSALAEVGGWDEWCITEDAELSLRLLRAGWGGQLVEESFGTGIMPLTFEALKRQRFRWCFGGVQLLRMHWRSLMPWDRSADNRLTLSQRWAYLVGGLQWFGDVAGMLFTCFLLTGAADAVLGKGLVIRRLSGLLLLCILVLTVLGAVRCVGLVRRAGGATRREALGALGVWVALGWCVAQAAVKGLVAREGAFLRTPKVREKLTARDALRGNLTETLLAAVSIAGAVVVLASFSLGHLAVSVLLVGQAVGYAAAPLNSLAAQRADLPPELRRRRRQLLGSWSGLGVAPRRLVLSPLLVVAAVAVVLGLAVSPAQGPPPGDVPSQAQGPAGQPSTPAPSRSKAPSTSSTTPTRGVSPVPAEATAPAHPTLQPTVRATVRPTSATPSPTRPAPTQRTTPTGSASASQRTTPTQRATPAPGTTPTQRATPTRRPSPTARPTRSVVVGP